MSEFSMWPLPGFVRSDFVRQYRGERRLTHILTVRPFCWVVFASAYWRRPVCPSRLPPSGGDFRFGAAPY